MQSPGIRSKSIISEMVEIPKGEIGDHGFPIARDLRQIFQVKLIHFVDAEQMNWYIYNPSNLNHEKTSLSPDPGPAAGPELMYHLSKS
jgi:hypothetical protein